VFDIENSALDNVAVSQLLKLMWLMPHLSLHQDARYVVVSECLAPIISVKTELRMSYPPTVSLSIQFLWCRYRRRQRTGTRTTTCSRYRSQVNKRLSTQ